MKDSEIPSKIPPKIPSIFALDEILEENNRGNPGSQESGCHAPSRQVI